MPSAEAHLVGKRGVAGPPEDAVSIGAGGDGSFRAAVADGATEAYGSGRWARLLVEGWTDAERPLELEEWTGERAARWRRELSEGETAWFHRAKRSQGSFATFLGATWQMDGRWRALSVGDCVLARIRNGGPVEWLACPAQFDDRPNLIATQEIAPKSARLLEGSWHAGDQFWLMTDAIAQWATTHQILPPADEGLLEALVDAEREAGRLRNDDVASISIRFGR